MRQQDAFEILKKASQQNCEIKHQQDILERLCPAFNGGRVFCPSREQMQLLAGTILLDAFCHTRLAKGKAVCLPKDILGLFPLVVAGICDKSETSWLATVDWRTHRRLNS